MRKIILIFIISSVFTNKSMSADEVGSATQLFYKANSLYETGDYAKAIENYIAILDMGLESGNLYYNIGNGFLKLGKVGYAILCYEKAARLMPGDSDLKANLNYTRSLIYDASSQIQTKNIVMRLIERPFKNFNLNTFTILVSAMYLFIIILSSLCIIRPIIVRKFRLIFVMALLAFVATMTAFAVRYYDEAMFKHGVVIDKEVECRYEPIEKATTYYKLHEGNSAVVLQTRNGWKKIKRLDGKIAWVKKEAVEEI